MKLYTRSGDDGSTGLYGGGRVAKDHPRVEAYGSVDELNAALGLAAAVLDTAVELHRSLQQILGEVQSRLLEIGADLATPVGAGTESRVERLGAERVDEVEAWIDRIDAGNEPMRTFILPGGGELAARLHVARTICRRAERRLVALARSEEINDHAIRYVNRLSDLLFAMARRANREAGVADVPWTGQA
jgi:cob(I)alamin adenosyltransferase